MECVDPSLVISSHGAVVNDGFSLKTHSLVALAL